MTFDLANYYRLSEAFMDKANLLLEIPEKRAQSNRRIAEIIGPDNVPNLVLCYKYGFDNRDPEEGERNIVLGYNGKILAGWRDGNSEYYRHGRNNQDWTITNNMRIRFYDDNDNLLASSKFVERQTSSTHLTRHVELNINGKKVMGADPNDENGHKAMYKIAMALLK